MNRQLLAWTSFPTTLLGFMLCLSSTGCGCDPNLGPAFPAFAVDVTADREAGVAGTSFKLTGQALAAQADIASLEWDFGDGTTGTGGTVEVSFSQPGRYAVELTVTDTAGRVETGGIVLTVFDENSTPGVIDGVKIGDVDGDGSLTLTDVHLVMKHATALEFLTDGDAILAADINQDGEIDDNDTTALARAVVRGQALPFQLSPAAGYPGTLANIISPLLMDPNVDVEIAVGTAPPLKPFRGALGYATFVIPLDVAGPDPTAITAGPISIEMWLDGVNVATFTFQLRPTPAIVGKPGDQLKEIMDLATGSITVLKAGLDDFLDQVGASDEEKAVLQGLLSFADEELADAEQLFTVALAGADEQTLTLLSLAANANGLQEALQELQALVPAATARLKNGQRLRTSGDTLIDSLCQFNAIAAASSKIDKAIGAACATLALGAMVPGPQQPFVAAVATVCSGLALSTDVISLVSDFVPDVDKRLIVRASPTTLGQGDKATITVLANIRGVEKLCNTGIKKLQEKLIKKLTERLIKKIPVARIAFQIIKRYRLEDRNEALRLDILKKIKEQVEKFSGLVLQVTRISTLLDMLRDTICSIVKSTNPTVELGTDTLSRFDALGVNPGTLVTGSAAGEYTCPDDGESAVTITAERTTCDDKTAPSGSASVTCGRISVTITMGDNGNLTDDIFEVRIDGKTVLSSSSPVTSASTTIELSTGQHELKMIGRAAPDDIGTYFVQLTGATIVSGPPTSGSDLTAGTVFTWTIAAN